MDWLIQITYYQLHLLVYLDCSYCSRYHLLEIDDVSEKNPNCHHLKSFVPFIKCIVIYKMPFWWDLQYQSPPPLSRFTLFLVSIFLSCGLVLHFSFSADSLLFFQATRVRFVFDDEALVSQFFSRLCYFLKRGVCKHNIVTSYAIYVAKMIANSIP